MGGVREGEGVWGEVGDAKWTYDEEGYLYSLRFGDVYGSRSGFLGQSEEVFWQSVRGHVETREKEGDVVVCEWGFGVGINFLTTWRGWDCMKKEGGGRLIYVGCEGYPLDVFSLGLVHRGLGVRGGEYGEKGRILRSCWRSVSGYFSCDVAEDVTLILMMGDVGHCVRNWDVGECDVWYMDGFAPRINPEMYSGEVCEYMARKSREGARVAGYSVAGSVKRGLEEVGFEVHKREGYGKKRHRLEALWKGCASPLVMRSGVKRRVGEGRGRVTIVGEGIAGLCCAYRCRERGLDVRMVVSGTGGGASMIPTALVTPGIPDVKSEVGVLRLMAFEHATRFYRSVASDAVSGEGSLHMLSGLRRRQMERRGGERVLWDYGMGCVSKELAREIAGVDVADEAVLWRESLCMRTSGVRESLKGEGGERIEARITGVERRGDEWVLREGGREVCGDGRVILACGEDIAEVWGRKLRTDVVRQEAFLAWVEAGGMDVPHCTLMDRVYVTPPWKDGLGVWCHTVGAVSEGGGEGGSIEESLWERVGELFSWCDRTKVRGWMGAVRVKTRDRLPLCGTLKGEGVGSLSLLGGLGSHGYTLAPLLSQVLVSEVMGEKSVLPQRLRDAIDV